MKKILLAINHKETEETIKTMVKDDFLCVGTATYKEAVLPLLKDTQPDVLVLRDTLQGNTPILQMIEDIRIEAPDTRIVFISKLRSKTDSLLAALVSYGIYDIINKDIVPVDEMVSHIIHPRNFRDVSLYYTGVEKVEHEPEESMPENTQPKPGFWGSLFGSKPKTEPVTNPAPFQNPDRQAPAVDTETLRMAIREEERRKVQQDMDALIQDAIHKATKELSEKVTEKDASIAELKVSLRKKNQQAEQERQAANEAQVKAERAERMLQSQKEAMTAVQAEHAKQIAALAKADDPKWFQTQLAENGKRVQQLENALSQREQELQDVSAQFEALQKDFQNVQEQQTGNTDAALAQAQEEIQKLQHELQTRKENADTDFDGEEEGLQLAPAIEYTIPANDQNHSIIFLGAKHGVGNTTVALNTAVNIASNGYKVLLLELNPNFPMLNHFFEFTSITNGIDTACDGILSNNTQAVDMAIIQPHLLRPKKRELRVSYKKLPPSLHFMLYSNEFLIQDKHPLDQRAIKDMFYYLTVQKQYSYILIDLQPDDTEMQEVFLRSGFLADKLILTMTQDTHSIVSAGHMMEMLSASRAANLIANETVVLNRYQNSASVKRGDVQKWLKLKRENIICLSDDPVVYFDSSGFGIPYACSKGRFVSEYNQIASTILA